MHLRIYSALLCSSLLLFPNEVLADPVFDSGVPVDQCELAHIKGTCRPAPLSPEDNMAKGVITTGGKVQVKRTLTLPTQMLEAPGGCEASFKVDYFQAYDKVKVDTEVQHEGCVASFGEYELRVRTVDDDGETLTRTYSEPWSRAQPGKVTITKHYPMDGDDRLIWVRVKSNRKIGCTCAERQALPKLGG